MENHEYPQTFAILKHVSSRKTEDYENDQSTIEANGGSDQERGFKGGWSSAIYTMASEVAERFANFGISTNLMMYMTDVLHESLVHAAETYYAYVGFSALLPLIGAFIADSYTGRYKAIFYSSLIYIVALVVMTVSVGFVPVPHKKSSFYLSLYLVVLAQAGFRPCILALAADQFNEESEKEKRAKNSFFNWWFFSIATGASAAAIIVSYIQTEISWWAGFLFVAVSMILAFFIFISGRKLYRLQVPEGSPWTSVFQVLVAAFRKRRITPVNDIHPHVNNSPYHTNQYKFLDKATILDELDKFSEVKNPWRVCNVAQVEDVKMLIRITPIWFACLVYYAVMAQPSSFFVKQSALMNREIFNSFTLTPVSFVVSIGLINIITVPLYDQIFVPLSRRITDISSGITILQRIGTGLVISVITMVVAALVETKRLEVAREYGLNLKPKEAQVPMTVMWLLPQCVLLAVSEVFAYIGVQQFFYDQMPDGMKSIGSAVYLSAMGIGGFISHLVVSMVAKLFPLWLTNNLNASHLDYFYWILAGLSLIWFCIFCLVSRSYVYKRQ